MAARAGADLLRACERVFNRIGTAEGYNGSKCAAINDEQSAAVLEYAVASHLEKIATDRKKSARAEVFLHLATELNNLELGPKVNIFTSPHANLDAQVVRGQTRINKDKLFIALTKALGSATKATLLIEEASEQGESQVRLSPVIVAVGD